MYGIQCKKKKYWINKKVFFNWIKIRSYQYNTLQKAVILAFKVLINT